MILKLTLTGLPPAPLAFCVICPVWFGTNSSGPRSPTIVGLPFDTAPPLANPNNFAPTLNKLVFAFYFQTPIVFFFVL